MQRIDVPTIRYLDHRQKIYFHLFNDLHVGAEGCDEYQLDKDIEAFKEGRERGEIHIGALGGDAINGIGPKDKRHDGTAVAKKFKKYEGNSLFDAQADAVIEKFKPIKDWLIFGGDGNHEKTVYTTCETNPTARICKALNIPYAGYCAGFRLRLDPQDISNTAAIIGLWHHGFGGGRTKGGKANLGVKLQEILRADVYLTGHVHEPILMPDEELSLPRRGKLNLKARDKLVVIGASYLKTYPTNEEPQTSGNFDETRVVKSDYGERSGFRPAVIGHFGFTLALTRQGKKSNQRVKLRLEDYR